MKLFQTALKLHAQGPRFFDEAADAYDALFESEIFKYPESKTEYISLVRAHRRNREDRH